jgi:S-adenosylmethionine:tRNA ribosyltransferase-isomerase
MTPATWPRDDVEDERLLVVDPRKCEVVDRRVRALPESVRAGDLLVVNDAATLPASLHGKLGDGRSVEVRLLAPPRDRHVRALLFGAGDWRTPTEGRPPLGAVRRGDRIEIGADLSARIVALREGARFVDLRFEAADDDALIAAIYAHGRPIQYSYIEQPLALWHVQNRYSSRPWAVELPSAGHVLTWSLLDAIRRRGARVVAITHAAGLSSTGDAELDRALPLPERYEIPEATARAVRETRSAGGRVIAIGTSVVRALEGAARANGGELRAGEGITDLLIGAGSELRVVDGLLTGMHELGASHRSLLLAFASKTLLDRAYDVAETRGYRGHEFGDVSLILAA